MRPVEIVKGALYALGGVVAADGRVSWIPRDASGFQPLNCYLLLDEEVALLIDTGAAAHRDTILAQLRELLPSGRTLSIFLTRAEFDCIGNLLAVCSSFPVETLYTGGISNPFDAFDSVASTDESSSRNALVVERKPPGQALCLSTSRELRVLSPSLRILATFWAYDTATKTLFTSDSFGHTYVTGPQDARVVDEGPREIDADEVRRWTYAKFGWLARARRDAILKNVDAVFADHQVDVIAPTHGCVLRGAAVVRAHCQALRTVLSRGGG